MLITIQEYAENNSVDKKTVEYHLRIGNLTSVKKYGKRLIDSRTKYPQSKAGRPAKTTKRK
jgi:hypothetical protein